MAVRVVYAVVLSGDETAGSARPALTSNANVRTKNTSIVRMSGRPHPYPQRLARLARLDDGLSWRCSPAGFTRTRLTITATVVTALTCRDRLGA